MNKNSEIKIKVDPLNKIGSKTKIESNIKKNIIDFIDSLSYDGFILAGNSVANIIENIEIKNDLDFWVLNKEKYLNILEEFKNKDPLVYDIYPSMIEIVFKDLPVVNLILSDMSAEKTVNGFDFDYCRCYYTKQTGCMASEICLTSIFTKIICNEKSWGDIRFSRIMKAIKYNYSFTYKFWYYFSEMLQNKEKLQCNICRVSNEHSCQHYSKLPLPIQITDLKIQRFEQTTIDIKITNSTDINGSIVELEKIFKKNYRFERSTIGENMFKLPKLFSFTPKDFDLVKIYVNKIIIFNPVRDGNYMEIKFKDTNSEPIYSIYEDMSDEEYEEEYAPMKKSCKSSKKAETESEEESEPPKKTKGKPALKSKAPIKSKGKKVETESSDEEYEVSTEDPILIDDLIHNDSSSEEEYNTPIHNKQSNKILNYDPINNLFDEEIIYLNASKTSYLKIKHLPDNLKTHAVENFNVMFNLHPEEKHRIIMYLKEVEVNRWQQSYLSTPHYKLDILRSHSYMYSGFDTSNNNIQLPEQFQVYYEYMKLQDEKYNQVVVNWYQDKNDYIAYHADCENGMIPNAEIAMISLYEKNNDITSNYRIFSMVPKNKEINCQYDKINIVARHGTIITMCGNTQKEFKHSIEKTDNNVIPRISISFRQFLNYEL